MSKSIPRISVVCPNGGTTEVLSRTISLAGNTGVYQGLICAIKIVTPNFTNTITVTVSIYDKNGIKKWTQASIAENSGATGTCYYPPWPGVPVESGEYIGVLPSGDPGGTGGTVTIDMEFIPDPFMRV